MKALRGPVGARRLAGALAVASAAACVSSEVDPRSAIVAPPEYVGTLAKSVNGSELWQAYFEAMAPSASGPPLVEVRLGSSGGPGGASEATTTPAPWRSPSR